MITIRKITYNDLGSLANSYEELLERKTNLEKLNESFNWINSYFSYLTL